MNLQLWIVGEPPERQLIDLPVGLVAQMRFLPAHRRSSHHPGDIIRPTAVGALVARQTAPPVEPRAGGCPAAGEDNRR